MFFHVFFCFCKCGAGRVAVGLRRGSVARATRRRRRERRCGLVLQVAIDGRALALREFEEGWGCHRLPASCHRYTMQVLCLSAWAHPSHAAALCRLLCAACPLQAMCGCGTQLSSTRHAVAKPNLYASRMLLRRVLTAISLGSRSAC